MATTCCGIWLESKTAIGQTFRAPTQQGARSTQQGQPRFQSKLDRQLDAIPFDGRTAFKVLEDICKIGTRQTGTEGMRKQIAYIKDHFEKIGGKVEFQKFTFRHPLNGTAVQGVNTIIRWHPDRKRRIIIGCHYDTRPYPEKDTINPRGVFVGANDGASGIALLSELGKAMPKLKGEIGVDFVFFDAEEYVFPDRIGEYFLGSTHFAKQYIAGKRNYVYESGILIDMIADANLNLYYEQNSLDMAGQVTRSIWRTARKLRVTNFIAKKGHQVRDDHIPLNQIAKIPTCDIIDFDYPRPNARFSYWHTTEDTPDKCSPLSIAKVGWVIQEWLKSQK